MCHTQIVGLKTPVCLLSYEYGIALFNVLSLSCNTSSNIYTIEFNSIFETKIYVLAIFVVLSSAKVTQVQ